MAEQNPEGRVDTRAAPPESLTFLVRSWNRFEVLNALESTTRTRRELRELTGVSRPTLSRILSDLVDRGWVTRQNDVYRATPIGRVVAGEMESVVANIDAARDLGAALDWFDTEAFGFDLAHLADAEILTPQPQDQTRPMRQLATYIGDTSEMRCVATGVTYEVVDAICEACIAGSLHLCCIMDDDAVAGVSAEPDLASQFVEMIDRGQCTAYRYVGAEELIDFNVLDTVVCFCGISDGGLPQGVVVSDDDSVRSWATYHFDTLREQSAPLDADAFTA